MPPVPGLPERQLVALRWCQTLVPRAARLGAHAPAPALHLRSRQGSWRRKSSVARAGNGTAVASDTVAFTRTPVRASVSVTTGAVAARKWRLTRNAGPFPSIKLGV